MWDFIAGVFGQSNLVSWAVGAAATAFVPVAFNWFRKLGWEIDQIHAQQFQVAVTNAAGQLAQKMAAGQLSLASAGAIALELAGVLIRDNPDTVKGLGVADNPRKVADKILAKVPQVAEAAVVASQAGIKAM